MVELFANSEDPDEMLHSAVSDLGLHCLPITLLGVSWLQWVRGVALKSCHCLEYRWYSGLSFWSGLFHLWMWTCPLMQIDILVKNKNRIANSVDPDEVAHYEVSDLVYKAERINKATHHRTVISGVKLNRVHLLCIQFSQNNQTPQV